MAAATDGIFSPKAEEIATHGETAIWQLQDLWWLLVLVSIPLFFLDVALRRITISKEQISELRNRLRLPESDKAATAADTLMSLKRRKEEVRGRRKIQDVRFKTQDRKDDAPAKQPGKPPATAAESQKAYTSRLLDAKKRAETRS